MTSVSKAHRPLLNESPDARWSPLSRLHGRSFPPSFFSRGQLSNLLDKQATTTEEGWTISNSTEAETIGLSPVNLSLVLVFWIFTLIFNIRYINFSSCIVLAVGSHDQIETIFNSVERLGYCELVCYSTSPEVHKSTNFSSLCGM